MTEATMQVMAKLNGTWTDITSSCVTDSTGYPFSSKRGMSTGNEDDRLADTGYLTLTLKDNSNAFDPQSDSPTDGWEVGTKVVCKFVFEGIPYYRFYGAVVSMKPDDPSPTIHFMTVTVQDWWKYAYEHEFGTTAIQVNKTGDQGITTILGEVPTQPLATDLDVGVNEFDTLFDSVSNNTKVATEMNKIVLGELGYSYTRADIVNGETLVFENQHARNGLRTVAKRPLAMADAGYLLNSTGGYLLNSTGGRIALSKAEDAVITGSNFEPSGIDRVRGAGQIINRVKVTCSPKQTDASAIVLFKVTTPFTVSPGQTYVFDGSYTGAKGEKNITVNPALMIQPVATTDYTMNTNKYGTGTDLTADHVVSVVYEAGKPIISITNNSVYYSAVTLFQCRGQGVYENDTITVTAEDVTSQEAYGVSELSMSQLVQGDPETARQFANTVLYLNKDPQWKYVKVRMQANHSNANMLMFLTMDIGDLVHITDATKNLDSYFYIQGVSFTVSGGTFIDFSWIIKEHYYSEIPVTIEFSSGQKYVDFGSIPNITQLPAMTIIVDVTPASFVNNYIGQILGKMVYSVGTQSGFVLQHTYITGVSNFIQLRVYSDGRITNITSSSTPGLSVNTLSRLCVTYSYPVIDASYGKFYIDGADVTGSSTGAVLATAIDDLNNVFHIGYTGYGDGAENEVFLGKVAGCLIYNRKLSASEVSLDAATPGCITDGLLFRAPMIRIYQEPHYTDLTMTADDKVIDNTHGVVGTPNGSPICRI